MGGTPTAFGVNFADGRIKGYPSVKMNRRSLRDKRFVHILRFCRCRRAPYEPVRSPFQQGPVIHLPNSKRQIWRKWFRITYENKLAASRSTWAIAAIVATAQVISLLWVFFISRKFKKAKNAVQALDPHLLSVNLNGNIIITDVSKALCKATGFQYRDLVGKPLIALGNPSPESSASIKTIWRRIQKGCPWKGEIKLIRKDGATLLADAVITPLRRKTDMTSGFTVIYQDVSQKKHFESLSNLDELAGLNNRRAFNAMGPSLLRRAMQERRIFTLLLLDIDYFKMYNDTYGHPAGDTVLASIGSE